MQYPVDLRGAGYLNLTPRLKIIAESIRGYDSAADIGSDHAHLPIFLIKNEYVKRAVAVDINKGPVEIAKKRIKCHGAEAGITVRQGCGLTAIGPKEVEVIIIAGMGGILIRNILDESPETAKSAKLLVLQPMRDSEWLFEHRFDIIEEELVKEQGKIYEIIWAKPGGAVKELKGSFLIGDKIIEKKHPLVAEHINNRVNELIKIVEDLKGKHTENCRERAEECSRLIDFYKEVLQWVE